MLPDSVLSTEVISANFLFPRNIPKRALFDYEMGGVAIEDGSLGLLQKVWYGHIEGDDVVLEAPGVPPTVVLTVAGIKEFGFTFDQQMRLFVCYELESGASRYYWFDTVANAYTTTTLPDGSVSPRCSIDDKRALQSSASDIILAYVRAGKLYFRAQRERYLIEHELEDSVGASRLIQVGMNIKNRFQFLMQLV